MNCKICHNESKLIFSATILKKYFVKFYYCEKCGFLQTEEPYWLNEAYINPINSSDTGILQRNLNFAKESTVILFYFFDKKGIYLDFAGGYGIFVRLMRDIGFNFYWSDLFSKNIFSKGFEYNDKIKNIELITSFESFEHFVNPIKEIEKIIKITPNILFSTEILPYPIPKPEQWWYYGLAHGQHISFYSIKTLKFIAKKYGLNLYTNKKNFHLLTEKNINSYIIKVILKILRISYFIAKRKLKSKTMADMFQIQKEKFKYNTFG